MIANQNAHFTFKGNLGVSRHDWLRLTPAYSYSLVAGTLGRLDKSVQVLDPFAGTGTTGLVAAEMGLDALMLDINPFLIWLQKAKTRNYDSVDILETRQKCSAAKRSTESSSQMGVSFPPMRHIERWWTPSKLNLLARLKTSLDDLSSASPADDLLKIAFCRVMIANSHAAFNHQSMSLKKMRTDQSELFDSNAEEEQLLHTFENEVEKIISSASIELNGNIDVQLNDARDMLAVEEHSVDLLYTSPPYANRMSYIRELRPYMYWLGYISHPRQAGEMDWNTIGGTWGIATSRVAKWQGSVDLPLSNDFDCVLKSISSSDAPHATLLSNYVHKYFSDMFEHFTQAFRVIKPGGRAVYIVGNSTFYGNIVPTERWYTELLATVGFTSLKAKVIRKRNSKKELYEFEVQGVRP